MIRKVGSRSAGGAATPIGVCSSVTLAAFPLAVARLPPLPTGRFGAQTAFTFLYVFAQKGLDERARRSDPNAGQVHQRGAHTEEADEGDADQHVAGSGGAARMGGRLRPAEGSLATITAHEGGVHWCCGAERLLGGCRA